MENRQASQGGFTLLETMIALTIMVLAFGAIIDVESGSINASVRAKQMNIVGMLAKNKMVETEYDIQGKQFDEVKKEDAGTFAAPYDNYAWKTEIKEIEFPNLNVGGGGGGGNAGGGNAGGGGGMDPGAIGDLLTHLITNYLSKAVREVDVTITWKKGSGEQNFTLSTYWVDLNHEFQLSE